MQDHDVIQRFLFEEYPIRGELAHLDASWQEVLRRHSYPEAVRNLLGEMLTAAVLLSSTLKFNGSLIIQLQGTGPVTLAVAECTSENTLRGLAQWQGDVEGMDFLQLAGNATLVVTIDPCEGERYQGVIDLTGASLAAVIEDYMLRSQQLETKIWLTANEQSTAGMLLQKLPGDSNQNETGVDDDALEAWNRFTILAATLEPRELLNIPFQALLYRLFHEEDVRIFEEQVISFLCSCSRQRVSDMLQMIGLDEVRSIIADEGHVAVNCQFCNHYYEFDAVDAELIFVDDSATAASKTQH